MYWLDTALVTLILLGAGLGLWSGFLWQVARLISLFLALAAAVAGNAPAASWLSDHLLTGAEPRVSHIVAYVAVFLFVYIVVIYVARMIHRGMQRSDLDWLDRLLGAGLGAGKILAILASLCLLAAHVPHPTTQTWLKESRLAPYLADGLDAILRCLPEDYRLQIADGLEAVRNMVGEE